MYLQAVGSALIGLLSLIFCNLKVKLFFAQIISTTVAAVGLYNKNQNRICKSKKILAGRTVLVTGGTNGIGLEIAKDMAHRGARVIIAGPHQDEGLSTKKHIEETSGTDKIIFKELELSSLDSVRQFASDILKAEERLDILFNNHAIDKLVNGVTTDGLHIVMQENYIGTFLLTMLLLPLLKKTGTTSEPSRIVTTASVKHRFGKVHYNTWNDMNNSTCFINNASKFCLVMFSIELSKVLKDSNVVVNLADPGVVGGINLNLGFGEVFNDVISRACAFLFKNPWIGAQTAIHVALSAKAGQVTGKYFQNCQISWPDNAVYNEKIVRKVWNDTIQLVKLDNEEWN